MSEPKKKRQLLVTVEFIVEMPADYVIEDDGITFEIPCEQMQVHDTYGEVKGAQVIAYETQLELEEIHE
jgi:hypothetical protein